MSAYASFHTHNKTSPRTFNISAEQLRSNAAEVNATWIGWVSMESVSIGHEIYLHTEQRSNKKKSPKKWQWATVTCTVGHKLYDWRRNQLGEKLKLGTKLLIKFTALEMAMRAIIVHGIWSVRVLFSKPFSPSSAVCTKASPNWPIIVLMTMRWALMPASCSMRSVNGTTFSGEKWYFTCVGATTEMVRAIQK